MKKKQLSRLFVLILLLFVTYDANAQFKNYESSKSIVTMANGYATSVTKAQKIYFQIWINTPPSKEHGSGKIWTSNAPFASKQKATQNEEFRIYSIQINSDGMYTYYAHDLNLIGQTLLFQVDNNSATSSMTVSRYATDGIKVLKKTIYYLD
jgi:hypothetical protein